MSTFTGINYHYTQDIHRVSHKVVTIFEEIAENIEHVKLKTKQLITLICKKRTFGFRLFVNKIKTA